MGKRDYCFCTLAIGKKYRLLAKQLAENLKDKSPGTAFVILTDKVGDFRGHKNVFAYKHRQTGIWRTSNDRRFVIKKALEDYTAVIQTDVDSSFTRVLPERFSFAPGIFSVNEDLIEHIERTRPEKKALIERIAGKLDIDLGKARWIGESLYIVVRDSGREKEFVSLWGKIATFLELHGFHGGDGNSMGLAAAKVGYNVEDSIQKDLSLVREHWDVGRKRVFSRREDLERRIGYHYRLSKARLTALKDFNFYYR